MRSCKTGTVCGSSVVTTVLAAALGAGCSSAANLAGGEGEGKSGRMSAALVVGTSAHDVTAVAFAVVDAASPCSAAPIASATVPLEDEALPTSLLPSGGGTAHAFADSLFVLPPGSYRVCATPLAGTGPSAECGAAENVVAVSPALTNEVVLMSQCAGDPIGAVDVVAGLNDPPGITGVTIAPSKFITVCQSATITLAATDPNADAISYGGTILSGPPGTPGAITFSGNVGTFTPGSPGDYQIRLTATDPVGGAASLDIPLHVSSDVCSLVSLVGDIDNFVPDAADTPPVDPTFLASVQTADWGPIAPLDDSSVNKKVPLSHIYSLPAGAVVQSATLQFRFKSNECSENDGIYFSGPFSPPETLLVFKDVVGENPVSGKVYDVTMDLSTTPVRNIPAAGTLPPPCGLWSDDYKGTLNLLPQVQTGLLNMLFVDDVNLDYSRLSIMYTIP